MARFASKTAFTIGLLAVLMAVPAFGASINKSVKIAAGETADGATSINGSISVGATAVVTGGLKTVNGRIRVDDGATIRNAKTVNGGIQVASDVRAEGLTTVNGAVEVGPNSAVDGGISAVNGRISLDTGVTVTANVENVNGRIELSAAQVGGDLTTVNGDVELSDGAVLAGNLVVEKPSGFKWGKDKETRRKPRIVIGPQSRVEGTIELEREVDLFISESAEVGGVSGVMSIDDAVRFSGDSP